MESLANDAGSGVTELGLVCSVSRGKVCIIYFFQEGRDGLLDLLSTRNVCIVDDDGWNRIDAAEKERGEKVGKPREKFVYISDMLDKSTNPD